MSASQTLFRWLGPTLAAMFVLAQSAAAFGAGATTTFSGKTYFVKADGNDSNDGLSDATAWRTTSKVNNSSLPAGADVYFKAGDVWNDQMLVVDWNGTTTDRVVIGSYYMISGAPRIGYTGSKRAEINGSYDENCSATLRGGGTTSCAFETTDAVPSSRYTALVTLRCNSCDVQDLAVVDSAGRGIEVRQISYTEGYRDHRIVNNFVGPTANTGIQISSSRNDYVFGNTLSLISVAGAKADGFWNDHAAGILIGSFSPESANRFLDTQTVIENNDMSMLFGEGIIISEVGRIIFRGNRVGTTTDVPVYVAQCIDCVIEYNVLWGGAPGSASGTDAQEYGIGVFDETEQGQPFMDTSVVVRGNMVANSSHCIRLGAEPTVAAAGKKFSMKAYNNTCVNSKNGIEVGGNLTDANVGPGGIEFKNNIFFNEAGGSLCRFGSLSNVTMDFNLWGTAPSDSRCRGAHDTLGNPMLAGSNWNAKTSHTRPPVVADFALRDGSPARGSGTPLTSSVLNPVVYPMSTQLSSPCAEFDLKGSVIDAQCATRGTARPDLGAVESSNQSSASLFLTVD